MFYSNYEIQNYTERSYTTFTCDKTGSQTTTTIEVSHTAKFPLLVTVNLNNSTLDNNIKYVAITKDSETYWDETAQAYRASHPVEEFDITTELYFKYILIPDASYCVDTGSTYQVRFYTGYYTGTDATKTFQAWFDVAPSYKVKVIDKINNYVTTDGSCLNAEAEGGWIQLCGERNTVFAIQLQFKYKYTFDYTSAIARYVEWEHSSGTTLQTWKRTCSKNYWPSAKIGGEQILSVDPKTGELDGWTQDLAGTTLPGTLTPCVIYIHNVLNAAVYHPIFLSEYNFDFNTYTQYNLTSLYFSIDGERKNTGPDFSFKSFWYQGNSHIYARTVVDTTGRVVAVDSNYVPLSGNVYKKYPLYILPGCGDSQYKYGYARYEFNYKTLGWYKATWNSDTLMFDLEGKVIDDPGSDFVQVTTNFLDYNNDFTCVAVVDTNSTSSGAVSSTFTWDNPPVSAQVFSLTANEWNRFFCTALIRRGDSTARGYDNISYLIPYVAAKHEMLLKDKYNLVISRTGATSRKPHLLSYERYAQIPAAALNEFADYINFID